MDGDVYATRNKRRPRKGTDEKYKTRSKVGTTKAASPLPSMPKITEKPNYISRKANGPPNRSSKRAPEAKAAPAGGASPSVDTKSSPSSKSSGGARPSMDSKNYPAARSSGAGMSYNGSQSQEGPKKTTTNEHYNRPKKSAPAAPAAPSSAGHTKQPTPAGQGYAKDWQEEWRKAQRRGQGDQWSNATRSLRKSGGKY